MPRTIILVPDIYYRNWNEGAGDKTGEMWLCLRPMIATGKVSNANPLGDKLDDFLDWAGSPHAARDGGSGKLYDFKSPHELGMGMRVCGSDEGFMPINLPSTLDVQVRIGRRDGLGGHLPEQVIDLKRTIGCKAVAGAQEGEDALGYYGAGALPFAKLFNKQIEDQFMPLLGASPRDQGKIVQTSFAFLQQMEAGRRIRFAANQVHDAYATPETSRPVLEADPALKPVTTIYWFLGLMVRLGTQKELGKLKVIDRVDIALRDGGVDDYDMIPFPDAQGGQESAFEYFRKAGDGFSHTLKTELIDHEKRVYVGPGFRGFQRIDPPIDATTTLWSMESAGPQTGGALDGEAAAHGGLARLAAIEIRGVLKEDSSQGPNDQGTPPALPGIGNALKAVPGLYVTGTLKRYRRFPEMNGAANNPFVRTVMSFEPDPAMAAELAKLRDALGDAGLRPLLKGTAGDWTVQLLSAGILPWDGPNPVYRMLAERTGTAANAGPLTCQETHASFFLAAPVTLDLLKIDNQGSRHLWDPRDPQQWGAPASALALEQRWAVKAGAAWKDIRFNALQVRGITEPAKAAAHAMLLDEFDLFAAESPLRLEKILAVTALSPRMTELANIPADDPRQFDPLRDYEDDFVNLNTARIWRTDATTGGEIELEQALLRAPQRTEAQPTQCTVGGAQRRQTIPLLRAWPFEPLDVPKDEVPATIRWEKVRDEIARRYGLAAEPDKWPYRIDLEHTYGDRVRAKDEHDVVLGVKRSTRRGWPVELPTFVEKKDGTGRFVRCQYVPGAGGGTVLLTFDLSFLTFPAMASDVARRDERYALALAAWRSIAELASPASMIALHLVPANFDLLTALARSGDADPARAAARQGIVGGWASGIAKGQTVPITSAPLDAIRSWALALIGGLAPDPNLDPFKIPLSGAIDPSAAHLLRVEFSINRAPALAPVPAATQILAPVSQQPGLFRVAGDTMQDAWAKLGFGPILPALNAASAGPVWDQLDNARDRWTAERTGFSDSITPIVPPPLPAPPPSPAPDPHASERRKRELQSALIAALDGSDWFAPAGSGPRYKSLAVEPLLLPVGFAPCRPHLTLKQATQTALQRVMTALRDTIDLAYASWTNLTLLQWQAQFDAIARLAREGTPTQSAGLLVGLIDLLIDRLLFAEPDQDDAGNDPRIKSLARSLKSQAGASSGDFVWFKAAVRRRMLADPALFTDAKALLLSVIHFVEDNALPKGPPPAALARARFNRLGIDPDHPGEPSATTLSLDNLVFAGTAAGAKIEERLAFLETLDDARYGDSFALAPSAASSAPTDYAIDSYEELVDPVAGDGGWRRRPAVLPLVAANDGRAGRVVHLASRALLVPPLLRFAGESQALDTALAGGGSDWCVEQLERGLSGMAPSGTRLRLAAKRSLPALARTIERGVSFTLYRVTGDEERPQQFEKAFENDSFFLRLSETDYDRQAQPKTVIDSGAALGCESLLRDLLFAGAGSDGAASAIQQLALSATDYSGDFSSIVAVGDATLPGQDYALIRLLPQGAGWTLDIAGPAAQATIDAVRHIALFKPDGAAANDAARTAWLLIGFETQVWAPVEAELSQGRNLPQDRWAGAAAAPDAARFAPQFWQSVAQDAPASRHSLQRRLAVNDPAQWKKRPTASDPRTHVVKLDATWRNARTPRELLEMLLLDTKVAIGSEYASPTVLSAASKTRLFDQQLSIQIAHEQFGEDPSIFVEPLGNFPLEQNLLVDRQPPAEPGKQKWFDQLYDHFSVSLRWFAPSGTNLLALERIYVEFV